MKNYLCVGYSQTYGTLHGMYEFDVIYGTEEEALEVAEQLAYEVIDSYSCISEMLEENAEETGSSFEECASEEVEYYVCRLKDNINLKEICNLNWDIESIKKEYAF